MKIFISVTGALLIGILCLFLQSWLINSGNENIWEFINLILFQDITLSEGARGIGIFFIISQLFMQALQMGMVPLMLVAISLSIGNFVKPEKLGKVATKTMFCFIVFYLISAGMSIGISYFVRSRGFFDVNLPEITTEGLFLMENYNPLQVILSVIPSNIAEAFSTNNAVLAVLTVGTIIGLGMNKKPIETKPLKDLLKSVDVITHMYYDFLINKICPVAIFSMIARAVVINGIEYLRPVAAFLVTGVFIGIFGLLTIYPISIWITTGLNPIIFIKKTFKVALFAAATQSSAATLPLNLKTCEEELGCSEEFSSFIMPLGMTIHMNGTTAMQVLAVTFIATAAGIELTLWQMILAGLVSIAISLGVPAVPMAGATMIFVVLSGLGLVNELTIIGYALVLAMNFPVGMSVITMNVVGDAATNVIICHKEGVLNEKIYNKLESSSKSEC